MTRVHGRTILANFEDVEAAGQAAQRIRHHDLGYAKVDLLTEHVGERPPVHSAESRYHGPDLGLVSDLLGDSPTELVTRRPRLDPVLLTVVTDADRVPRVVAVIREFGGSV